MLGMSRCKPSGQCSVPIGQLLGTLTQLVTPSLQKSLLLGFWVALVPGSPSPVLLAVLSHLLSSKISMSQDSDSPISLSLLLASGHMAFSPVYKLISPSSCLQGKPDPFAGLAPHLLLTYVLEIT
jgi:hypothetical protein